MADVATFPPSMPNIASPWDAVRYFMTSPYYNEVEGQSYRNVLTGDENAVSDNLKAVYDKVYNTIIAGMPTDHDSPEARAFAYELAKKHKLDTLPAVEVKQYVMPSGAATASQTLPTALNTLNTLQTGVMQGNAGGNVNLQYQTPIYNQADYDAANAEAKTIGDKEWWGYRYPTNTKILFDIAPTLEANDIMTQAINEGWLGADLDSEKVSTPIEYGGSGPVGRGATKGGAAQTGGGGTIPFGRLGQSFQPAGTEPGAEDKAKFKEYYPQKYLRQGDVGELVLGGIPRGDGEYKDIVARDPRKTNVQTKFPYTEPMWPERPGMQSQSISLSASKNAKAAGQQKPPSATVGFRIPLLINGQVAGKTASFDDNAVLGLKELPALGLTLPQIVGWTETHMADGPQSLGIMRTNKAFKTKFTGDAKFSNSNAALVNNTIKLIQQLDDNLNLYKSYLDGKLDKTVIAAGNGARHGLAKVKLPNGSYGIIDTKTGLGVDKNGQLLSDSDVLYSPTGTINPGGIDKQGEVWANWAKEVYSDAGPKGDYQDAYTGVRLKSNVDKDAYNPNEYALFNRDEAGAGHIASVGARDLLLGISGDANLRIGKNAPTGYTINEGTGLYDHRISKGKNMFEYLKTILSEKNPNAYKVKETSGAAHVLRYNWDKIINSLPEYVSKKP